MTYAVVDMCARTLTYARAGHCPLMYLPGRWPREPGPGIRDPGSEVRDSGFGAGDSGEAAGTLLSAVATRRRVQVQAPDGLVLGLKIDKGERFDSLLREVTLPLGAGDLVLLFTDGVSEAMNAAGEPFGEERLAAVIEADGDLPFEELRERIIREIRAFVGDTGQHDDLTFVLLKVDNAGGPEGPPLRVCD